jgi:AcrR family transcriptional regulator
MFPVFLTVPGGLMRHDALRNRERILAAAEEVFAEQGAAGSTHEVARRAGVGIGTVFRHFATKEELVEAVLVRHFARMADRARGLAAASPPGAALRTLVREMIEAGPAKITLASLAGGRDRLSPGVAAASRELRAAVDAALRRAQDAGQARREATVDEVYLLVRSLAHASAAMPEPPETLHRAADIVLAGLASDGLPAVLVTRCQSAVSLAGGPPSSRRAVLRNLTETWADFRNSPFCDRLIAPS